MADSNNKRKWTCELSNYPNIALKTSKSVKGFTNEYKIINALSKKGYWVAKSIDPQCPFDIVVTDRNGKVTLLDIKTNSYRDINNPNWEKKSKKIYRTPTDIQKKLNIKLLMLDYED
jgi:hypothetical protein|tara:strand:- start:286 stop:636 length:351 start_codon:yes stop_codon:yes gene_type:complete